MSYVFGLREGLSPVAQPTWFQERKLEVSVGTYKSRGAIHWCCRFHKRSQDRSAWHSFKREWRSRTWTT